MENFKQKYVQHSVVIFTLWEGCFRSEQKKIIKHKIIKLKLSFRLYTRYINQFQYPIYIHVYIMPVRTIQVLVPKQGRPGRPIADENLCTENSVDPK